MFELIDTHPAVNVQEAEYQRLLGYPKHHSPDGRSRELADRARTWYAENGKPWIYARQTDDLELKNQRLQVHGTEFASKQLHDQFVAAHAHTAVLVAVSAGPECEEKARQLWQKSKPDEYFFMEMYGSAVVENLVTVASGHLCGWADQNGMAALSHYSPGYSGWDISDQIKLWKLIRQKPGREFPGDIQVLDTGMLRPKKSLLAVFGITRHLDTVRNLATLIPCENCSLPGCQYRRAPYRHSPPQIEDVRRLQGGPDEEPDTPVAAGPPLEHDARYSINTRALQKWSQERLQLNFLEDRSVEARFRYEGTTCSNLGRPLAFDYEVKLGPPDDGYRILAAGCVPTPGDTGYQYQCEYLNNAESLMRSIANEKPLLGKPLNAVLAWKRPYDPSGCYCDSARRAHKWGLVFEVIHYALVRREKEASRVGQPAGFLK
ncbi:MAG: hypothetical protein ABSC01_02915 [Verrucomicrobiota bacterium]|jgi:hypothetical protein